jgi:hypothetical protein
VGGFVLGEFFEGVQEGGMEFAGEEVREFVDCAEF